MGALTGFMLGYVLGARQGPEGYAKLRAAWDTIREAPEVKALLDRVPSLGEVAATASASSSGVVDAVASSPAVQSLVSTGLALANDLVERGLAILNERARAA
jgi:hypothetical protein